MNGTIFSVTRAMDLMPPMMTGADDQRHDDAEEPALVGKPALLHVPPVTLTNCTNAWFDWNMLPMPSAPRQMPMA